MGVKKEKKYLSTLFMLFLFITTISSSITIKAEALSNVKTIPYEEYIENVEEVNNSIPEVYSESNSNQNKLQPITDLIEGKETISYEKTALDHKIELPSYSTNVADLYTAPQVNLTPIILNEDSLRNGNITTDTQIAWLWDYADVDNDSLKEQYVAGFPSYYLLGILEGNIGFVTQFSNPGQYDVLYQAVDSAEEASNIVGYTVTVVPKEDFQAIEGTFSSATDVQTHTVNIDFNTMDTAAVCFVSTGKTYATMQIKDTQGNIVATKSTDAAYAKNWAFIDKPSTGLSTYTITLTVKTYDPTLNTYRLLIGNKKDTEAMISGVENAVYLDWYSEADGHQYWSHYTPNKDESWYRFTAKPYTVVTLLSYYPQIRFQIRDINNLDVAYDSNFDADAHSQRFLLSGYKGAEKARLSMPSGEYYLVIYSPSIVSLGSDLLEQNMNIAVGCPNMLSASATFYAGSSARGTATSYSPSLTINIGDDGNTLPRTAVAETAYLKSKTAGITPSKVGSWRIRKGLGSWKETTSIAQNMGYIKDSQNNININGNWQISFKARSSNSTISFIPGIDFFYYYELGD